MSGLALHHAGSQYRLTNNLRQNQKNVSALHGLAIVYRKSQETQQSDSVTRSLTKHFGYPRFPSVSPPNLDTVGAGRLLHAEKDRLAEQNDLLTTHTTHIFATDRGWVVVRDRVAVDDKSYKGLTPAAATVYATQKEAVEAARKIVEKEPMAQVVVHSRNGTMRRPYVHGLPIVQRSPVKSGLGTKAIKRAVSAALRERLVGQ